MYNVILQDMINIANAINAMEKFRITRKLIRYTIIILYSIIDDIHNIITSSKSLRLKCRTLDYLYQS